MSEDIEILVDPIDDVRFPLDRLREVVVRHPRVRERFRDVDPEKLRFLDPDVLGREKDRDGRFVATVFDPRSNLSVEVTGRPDQLEKIEVRPSVFRPNPSQDELRDAVEVLRATSGTRHSRAGTASWCTSPCRRWPTSSWRTARRHGA